MLILALVCTSWLEIIGIQSAKKEARRREAVERLAGMMDAFMYKGVGAVNKGYYLAQADESVVEFKVTSKAERVFEDGVSPIGYQLRIVGSSSPLVEGMSQNWAGNWLVGLLFDENGSEVDVQSGWLVYGSKRKPFFKLAIRL